MTHSAFTVAAQPKVQWRKYIVFITKLFLFTILILPSLSLLLDILGSGEDLRQCLSCHEEKLMLLKMAFVALWDSRRCENIRLCFIAEMIKGAGTLLSALLLKLLIRYFSMKKKMLYLFLLLFLCFLSLFFYFLQKTLF